MSWHLSNDLFPYLPTLTPEAWFSLLRPKCHALTPNKENVTPFKNYQKTPKTFNKYLLNVFCIQFSMNNYRYFPQYRSLSLKINIFWTKLWNKDACQNACFEVSKMPKAQFVGGFAPWPPQQLCHGPATALPWQVFQRWDWYIPHSYAESWNKNLRSLLTLALKLELIFIIVFFLLSAQVF